MVFNDSLYWPKPEKYLGENNGKLYKASIYFNYFDDSGFLNENFIKTISKHFNIPINLANKVKLVGYEPGNLCYQVEVDNRYTVFSFLPLVVKSFNGDFYDIMTGLRIVPFEHGPDDNSIAVDCVSLLEEDDLDHFANVIFDADNPDYRNLYYDYLNSVHDRQLNIANKNVKTLVK